MFSLLRTHIVKSDETVLVLLLCNSLFHDAPRLRDV